MDATTSNPNVNKMKTVYTVTERGGRSYWTRIGVGFTNRDGSINLRLEAVPVSGTMQVRDYEAPEAGGELARRAPLDAGRSGSGELPEALS